MEHLKQVNGGQTLLIFTFAIVAIVGAMALGTDVTMLYYNSIQLQKASDAAASAGASYLPDNPSTAVTTAKSYALNNGIKSSEITSNSVGAGNTTITVQLQRTVPYYFARVLGLTTGTVTASATSGPQSPPSTVNAPAKSSIPSGGDNNGNNGVYCSNTGDCSLLPIGLDSHTTYTKGTVVALQQGELGAGNWDLLALGSPGANALRSNIATGYNGMVSVGDWVTTKPGKNVGPVDQGFQDRIDLANTTDPSSTHSSHKLTNPRVVVLPVVDWTTAKGRSSVKVTAFATLWIDSYNKGQVNAYFIDQVIANTFGDPSVTSTFGGKGIPILLK